MRKLSDAGFEIGMHGCYEAYRDLKSTHNHYLLLNNALIKAGINQPLKGNRQHYLRWDSSKTPAILDASDFLYDTTGGFADCSGFRFGTAREFSMWDWGSETQLKLCQRPLIVMDRTIIDDIYMGLGTGAEASDYIKMLRDRALKFGGQFTILWHNTSLIKSSEADLLREVIG